MIRRAGHILTLALALGGSWGCTSQGLRTTQSLYAQGNVGSAVAAATVYADEQKAGRDAIIAQLELGHILFTADRPADALAAFDAAEAAIDQLDLLADTSVTEEILVAYTNPEQARYRPTATDRVMSSVFRALLYLQLGQTDRARPALVEASFRVEDAQANYTTLNKTSQEALQQASRDNGFNAERTTRNPTFQSALNERYANVRAYVDADGYKHPLADWLRAIYLLSTSNDPADADVAVALLTRVQRTLPNHPGIAQDLRAAQQAAGFSLPNPLPPGRGAPGLAGGGAGEPPSITLETNRSISAPTALGNTTYIVFATGLSPVRDEFVVNLPLFLVNNEVDFFGIALPTLEYRGDFVAGLAVRSAEGVVEAQLLADIDRVVSTDFELQKPAMITRAIGIAVTKATTAWAVGEALENSDPLVQFAVRLGMGLYQYGTNTADRRSWNTLPKHFLLARTPTPADGVLTLEPRTGPNTSINVPTTGINIIYVRSIRPNTPLHLTTLHLEPAR